MFDGKIRSIWLICFLAIPSFILQAAGCFSAHWISADSCQAIGLLYNCCMDSCERFASNAPNVIDDNVFGLELSSLEITFLAAFGKFFDCFCRSRDDESNRWADACRYYGSCSLVILPVAGLLSFVGCMLTAVKYTTSQLGWSFYVCLAFGCIHILFILILISFCFCKCFICCYESCERESQESKGSENRKGTDDGTGYQYKVTEGEEGIFATSEADFDRNKGRIDTGNGNGAFQFENEGAIAPYDEEPTIAFASVHQRAVVHDESSGNLYYIERNARVAQTIQATGASY